MLRRAQFAIVLAATGCLGGGGAPPAQTVKLGPEIDKTTAESDAKGLVDEVYSNIGRGKPDNLIPLLAPPLVVYGPRRLDVAGSRADALVALGKVVDPKKAAQVISGALAVRPATGGRSAWAVDVIQVGGQPMAITAVLSNSDDLWLVDAAAIARTPNAAMVKAELKKDAVVPPGMATGPKSDPRAAGAAERFSKGIVDQAMWQADLESVDNPVMIGPAAGEVARGKKDVKAQWTKRAKRKTREIAVGEVVASVTPDGQLAWVTAPVTRAADDEDVTPLRVFAIYENAGGQWKLTALHEALAIDEPGAGVAFKKIAPPVPVAAPPPPPPAEVATKADKKPDKHAADKHAADKKPTDKTKKLAKKKAPVEDEDPPVKKKKKKKKKKPVEDTAGDDDTVKVTDDEDAPAKKKPKKKPAADDDGDDVKVIDE